MKRFGFILFILLLTYPALAQDQAKKVFFLGAGIDSSSTPNVLGFGGYAMPATSSTLVIFDWDVSAIPGATFHDVMQGRGLKFTAQVAMAQRVFKHERFSLWGIVSVGPSWGPGALPVQSPGEGINEPGIDQTPIDVTAAYTYGGFLDIPIKGNWGIDIFGQSVKDAAPNGFRPVVRVAVRYKFQ